MAPNEVKIAVILDKIVTNTFIMPGMEIAKTWFLAGNMGPGDEIKECPEHVTIGWILLEDGTWSPPPEFKAVIPEPETPILQNGSADAIKAFLEGFENA